MIPEQAEIRFALVGVSSEVSRLTQPGAESCYCFEDFSEVCPREIPAQLTETPNLLSEAENEFHFDFRMPFAYKSEKIINVTATKSEQCLGIVQWLKINLFGDIVYENIPGKATSHWDSNIYLFQNPISIRQGQEIKIHALLEKDTLWFQCYEPDN